MHQKKKKKLNWYLSIATLTWVTKPYWLEEYENKKSKRWCQLRNRQNAKITAHCSIISAKKLVLHWGINEY